MLLVHNSAKVEPLQVFGKFRLLLPYELFCLPMELIVETQFYSGTSKSDVALIDDDVSRSGNGDWGQFWVLLTPPQCPHYP